MTKPIDETEVGRHRTKMSKRKAVQDAEVAGKTIEKGLLIVHTGAGKGKSTAAFGLALEAGVAVEHEARQIMLHVLIGSGLGRSVNAALDHDLRADLALWFEQHGIHVHAGRRARGSRLQRLRTTDLATVRGHCCVVRHVLRFERPDPESAVRQSPRDARDNQRFADVRARALEHERAGGQG